MLWAIPAAKLAYGDHLFGLQEAFPTLFQLGLCLVRIFDESTHRFAERVYFIPRYFGSALSIRGNRQSVQRSEDVVYEEKNQEETQNHNRRH